MKTFLLKWIRRFFPRCGATYGYVTDGTNQRGAYCLYANGDGVIYYYTSILTTSNITKRHYLHSTFKSIENYKTVDFKSPGDTFTLKSGDKFAKLKFDLILRQYKQNLRKATP